MIFLRLTNLIKRKTKTKQKLLTRKQGNGNLWLRSKFELDSNFSSVKNLAKKSKKKKKIDNKKNGILRLYFVYIISKVKIFGFIFEVLR